jgi:mannitol/fructose-specific phosphotransferase system IIA component (Ntr-type)
MPVPSLDLSPFLTPDRILFLDEALPRDDVLRQLASLTSSCGQIQQPDAFIAAILERELVASTNMGSGIAVPHAKLADISGVALSIGISQAGLDYLDGKDPVHTIVMIAAAAADKHAYLRVLASVAARLRQPGIVDALRTTRDPEQVIAAFTGSCS